MRILIVCLLVLWTQSYAQSSKATDELILDNYWFSSLSSDQNSILKSIIIRVVAEQRDYSIVIKDSTNQVNRFMYKLEISIMKKTEGFKIGVVLRNTKTKKKYKSYTKEKIAPRNLLLQTEYILRLIFELQDTDRFKALEKKLTTTISPLIQKDIPKKNSSSIQEIPSKQRIDFRKRIMDIKVDIPAKISQAKKKNKEEEDLENQKQISKGESLQKVNKKSNDPSKTEDKKSSAPWTHLYSIHAGYHSSNIEVMDARIGIETLKVRNEISLLDLGADIKTTSPYVDYIKLKTKLIYHKMLTEDVVPLDDYLEYSFLIGYDKSPINAYMGLNKDSIVFGSVPTIGEGIQPSKIDNYNLAFELSYSLQPYSARLEAKTLMISQNKSEHTIDTDEASLLDFKLTVSRKIIEFSKNIEVFASLFKRSYSNEKDLEINSVGYSIGSHFSF